MAKVVYRQGRQYLQASKLKRIAGRNALVNTIEGSTFGFGITGWLAARFELGRFLGHCTKSSRMGLRNEDVLEVQLVI